MIAPGPGHYVVGRTTKVARAQPRENVGVTRRQVEPTGIAVERSETLSMRSVRSTPDLLLAKQALSQLSYGPKTQNIFRGKGSMSGSAASDGLTV